MEENAIIANIATIITKDLLFDKDELLLKRINQKPTTLFCTDDEDLLFFQKQMQKEQSYLKLKFKNKRNDEESKFKINCNKKRLKILKNDKCDPQNIAQNYKRKHLDRNEDINLLNKFSPKEFENNMHMSKMSFLKIFQYIRGILEGKCKLISKPQTVFSIALWKLTTAEDYHEIEKKFHIAMNQSSLMTNQFVDNISANYKKFVHFPNSIQIQKVIQDFSTNKLFSCFNQLIGVIALKRWNIFFKNKNKHLTVILQIICDSNEKIIDCFVELEDNYNFNNSPIYKLLTSNKLKSLIPNGSYLIGDKYFPLRPYLIRPFDDTEISNDKMIRFNILLKPAITMAQEVLNKMAISFNCLYSLKANNVDHVRKIVQTVCTLHNLCVAVEDDYVERTRNTIKMNWALNDMDVAFHDIEDIDNDDQNYKLFSDGIQQRNNLMHSLLQ